MSLHFFALCSKYFQKNTTALYSSSEELWVRVRTHCCIIVHEKKEGKFLFKLEVDQLLKMFCFYSLVEFFIVQFL